VEHIFPSEPKQAPEIRAETAAIVRGRSAESRSPQTPTLDIAASFTQSFRNTGSARLIPDQLIFKTPDAKTGTRFVFVVDASGSHAAQQRMRSVKGATAALLKSSVDPKDEVAVVAFRGAKADVVLPPCRDADAATRVLEFLPTGGRTPLAHALELAETLVTDASLLVLITDGRANVPLMSADPWADALHSARSIKCPSLVIDSSLGCAAAAETRALAGAMRGRWIALEELNQDTLIQVLRS
jgi:magnesium chelatase subunit D